jgi:dTDP-4-amino-4,6-dideoxygalactose transaminase
MGFAAEDFPEAVTYYREAISLPMFQGLTNEQQDTVLTSLKMALTQ